MLRPFADLNIWEEAERKPNNLVTLVPALAVVAYKTISACEGFTRMIEGCVTFHDSIVPNMKLFVRGYFNEVFGAVLRDAGPRVAKVAG